jgi:1-acylglycerone phosphate reductase
LASNKGLAGVYGSSKIAAQRLSDTLRIELEPLGIKVITGMIGAIHTPIHDNAGDLHLPEGSYYHVVKETIRKQRQGQMKPGSETPEQTAKNIVADIVNGKTGPIWRGGMASTVRYLAALLPGVLGYIVNGDKGLKDVAKAYQN